MPLLTNFRENLREQIVNSGESKTAIAERAGIHRVTLHKILAGEFDPSLEMCEKLAEALKIKPIEKIFQQGKKSA